MYLQVKYKEPNRDTGKGKKGRVLTIAPRMLCTSKNPKQDSTEQYWSHEERLEHLSVRDLIGRSAPMNPPLLGPPPQIMYQ